jgi:hypothetical protein
VSNYLSKTYQAQAPQDYSATQIAAKVAYSMQGKYDQNKSQIDQTLALYTNQLKGLRDVDNEYIAEKMKQVKSAIKEYSVKNGDLSRNYNKDSILTAVTSVMDDTLVQDALSSYQNASNYDKEYAEIIKKTPGAANNANYAYGKFKGGYQDYMEGKTNKLGGMKYIPSVDYQKELKDIVENLDKYDTEIKRSSIGGDGYIYTQEGKTISAGKVRQISEALLSDGAKQQMTINGWASYHQGNTQQERDLNTKVSFENFKNQYESNLKDAMVLTKAEANKTGSEVDKIEASNAEKNYNNSIKNLENVYNRGTSEQMYGLMYREGVLSNVANTFAYNNISETISSDSTYMAKVKMEYDREKDERNYQLALRKQEFVENKEANTKSGSYQTKADFEATPDITPEDITKDALGEINDLDNSIKDITNNIYENLDEEIRQGIDAEIKASKGLKTKEDLLIDYAKGGKVSNSDAINLNRVVNERYVKQNEINIYTKEVVKQAESSLDSESFLKELHNNSNVKMTWFSNGKEKVIPVKDVLKATGIVDNDGNKIKSINDVPRLKEYLKKSMLTDKYLSDPRDRQQNLREIAKLNGEDYLKITQKVTRSMSNTSPTTGVAAASTYEDTQLNPNSKTYKFIENQKKSKGYNVDGIFSSDDSFDDLTNQDFYKKITSYEINKKIGEKIKSNSKTSFALITTVQPGTSDYKRIAQQANFESSGSLPINMKQVKGDNALISLSVGRVGEDSYKEIVLRKEDLPKETLNSIDLYNTKSVFSLGNFPPLRQKATFTEMSGTNLAGYSKAHYGSTNSEIANLSTKKGAKAYYHKNYQELLGKESNPTKLGSAISKLISDPEIYIITEKTENKDGIYILPKVVKGGKALFETPMSSLISEENSNKLDALQQKVKFRPQEFINEYILALLRSENVNEIDNLIKTYGTN